VNNKSCDIKSKNSPDGLAALGERVLKTDYVFNIIDISILVKLTKERIGPRFQGIRGEREMECCDWS
jgi:hypothetical protein